MGGRGKGKGEGKRESGKVVVSNVSWFPWGNKGGIYNIRYGSRRAKKKQQEGARK